MEEAAAPVPGARDGRGAGQAPPWVVDALLGTAVALALALVIAIGVGGTRRPDLVAYLFAAGFGALLLLRRRLPRTVLVLSVLGVFAYYTRDYPPIGVAVPVVPALYSVAEAGLLRWSVGGGLVVFVVSLFFRLRDGEEAVGFLLGYETVSNLALFAAATALGASVRGRRIQALQQAEIARLTGDQLAREAASRLQGERERISRELHDTVGHTLSVISLQAGVAAEAVGRDERAVAEALERIGTASRQSLGELRSMVRLLRSAGEDTADESRGVRSLAGLQELVDSARRAGLEVTTAVGASPAELSAPVDAAAYRVVQEAITNVLRHAGATRASVTAEVREGRLELSVTDDGRGAPPGGTGGGYGLAGMAERVRLLGGSLTTGPGPAGGFRVQASLPARLSP
ncbi:sensor histidine kinase [Auraticoccus cholistanensis]|uniref:sensor histidine kinase n=1 Tax=Auraticoccus cholistanensis TaxID=2656650 RepID=UPI0018D20248